MNDAGVENSAILLLTMGAEQAAEVMKFLSPKEVQRLSETMAKMTDIPRDRLESVLEEFDREAADNGSVGVDSGEYVRSVLTRALGNDKAGLLLDRILKGSDTSGIESLKWMDGQTVAELIGSEHPQIIASILVHLERDHAADILKRFDDEMRNDVVLRIATLDGIQPAALQELNDVLSKLLSSSENFKQAPLGGIRTAAEILNHVGSAVETTTLDAIREQDADLAQKIVDELFIFDNLNELDDKSIQQVLREVQSESLVIALKGASDALKEKILKNMSSRAAEVLRDDLESRGPVRLKEVEAEQKEILKAVRRLAEEGRIQIGGGGDDAYV
jgi:flagellar motor switch protein FliG